MLCVTIIGFVLWKFRKAFAFVEIMEEAFKWECTCGERKTLRDGERRALLDYRIDQQKKSQDNDSQESQALMEEVTVINDNPRLELEDMPTNRDQLTKEEKKHVDWVSAYKNTEIAVGCQCCQCCCFSKNSNGLCGTWFTVDPGMSFMFLLFFGGILIDVWDVYTDFDYFFKYENFQLVHRGIYRNVMVSNAIMFFGILGMIKLIATVLFLAIQLNNAPIIADPKGVFALLGKYNIIAVHLIEDCSENFLEYFYVEKYAVGGQAISYGMIFKVFLKIFIYGSKFVSVLKTMKRKSIEGLDERPKR